jgi:TP901 family phage tail tape measure protein
MAGDIKQIFTVDLDLVLGQLSGEKLDKQAKAEAQKSINELTRLLSQAAIEPEIPVKARVKVDGAEIAKSLNPSQIIEALKSRLSNPKFQKDPNLNKAIDKYFGDLAASFETVSTASFDKKVTKLFNQVKSGNKKFEELKAAEQEQLLLYRSALNDRLKLLRDVKSSSNRINRQIRAGDGEETFDLPAFILPQLTQGIADYGRTLKAFDKLTGLERQLRNKASAAERDFAQSNIAKIAKAGGVDKIQKGFPFRRVDKSYQTLIRDQEANLKATTDLKEKESIQTAIDKLNADREKLSVRRREILGSTLATSLENKQKTVDANLRMARELRASRSVDKMAPEERTAYGKYLSTAVSSSNQIQQKLANTSDEAKAKKKFLEVQKGLLDYRRELKDFDRASSRTDAQEILNTQAGRADSLLNNLKRLERGSKEFRKAELRLRSALKEAKAAAEKLGDDASYSTYTDQQAAYDVFTGTSRATSSDKSRKEKLAKKVKEDRDRLQEELNQAYSQINVDPKALYSSKQQSEFGVVDEISRLELLAKRYGSNAGKALSLGLEDNANRFRTLGKIVAGLAKELKNLDQQPNDFLARMQKGNELDRLEGLRQEEQRKKYLAGVRRTSAAMAQKDREAAARETEKAQADTDAYLQGVRRTSAAMAQKDREAKASQEAKRKDRENRQEVRLINKGFTPENIDSLRAQFSSLGYRKGAISDSLQGLVTSDPLGIDGAVAKLQILQNELRSVAGVAKASGIKQLEGEFGGLANAVGRAVVQVKKADTAVGKLPDGATQELLIRRVQGLGVIDTNPEKSILPPELFRQLLDNQNGAKGLAADLTVLKDKLKQIKEAAGANGLDELQSKFIGLERTVGEAITQVNKFDKAANKPAKPLPGDAAYRREQNAQQSQSRTQLLSDIGRDAYTEAGGSISRIAKADHEATKTFLAERLKQLKAEETAIANSTMNLREQRQEMRRLGEEQDSLVMAQKELGMVMGNNVRPFRQIEMAAKAFVRYFVLYGAAYNVIYYFKNLAASVINFQDSLKQTQVIAQASQQEMLGIGSAIRDVASGTGESLQNVSAAAETLAQAGTAVANIPAALKAVSDFALATGSSLQVASDIITSAKEIFGENLTFSGAADQLTRAVNISKLKAEDLRTIFNLGAQTAQASGLSSSQFLGASATLSNLGIKSSTIATGLRQLLLELFNPDEKTIAFLRRRYNELGERLSDQEITSRFQDFQKTSNPLLSSLTELRRLGVAGSAQDDFRRVIDIRAENVALPLVRRLDQLASNTAQINTPGAAAAGAKERVETLSRAFDQLKVKAELLAEVMGKPLLDKLVGFTQGVAGFVDSLISSKEKLKAQGGESSAGIPSAIAGGFIGSAIGRRLGLGRVGSAVAGVAGAGAGYEVVQSSEGKPGDWKGKAAEYLLMISSILTIFGKSPVPKGSLGKAGDTVVKSAVSTFEWIQKGFEALRGVSALGLLSKLKTIASGWRVLALGTPGGLIVTAYTALELLYEGYKYVSDLIKERSGNVRLKQSPASDPDIARARIAEQQKKVDELADQLKNYDDNNRGSLTNEGRQIQQSLQKYNDRISELFGSGAEEAKAILAALGNTPIEGNTPFANEIKGKLDQIKVLNARQFSQLVTAQSEFTAAQQSLFGKAQDILRRVSELLKKPKEQLTEAEKKFLATYQELQNSPLFKPDAFKPEELSQAVQDYFKLISDQTTTIRDRYRREQAALSAVRFGDVRTAVRSAYGQPGDNNERQALRTQIATIRQNPSPEGQQFLDDFRSALNEVLQEIQAMPRNPQTEARLQQWITEVATQYQDLSRELQGNTSTMDTRQQRQTEQAAADQARQEDVDRRKQALSEETEKAERRYIELTTQRNNRLEQINDLDNKIKVAKEKEEYGKLLGAGGLLDQRQKAALEVAKADEELAAAKLREAALAVDPTLPRDVSNLNVDQIRTLNRDDNTQSLYSQYLDKARAVREVMSDSKAQREQIQQQSLQKIEFTPDQAFIDRQNEISKLQEELGDQVRENQDQLREKYNRLFELEDQNLEAQIEYLKSQEYKYTTPRDQAKFNVELNDLEQRRIKLKRETSNKRDEEIARLGEAEAKAQSEVIREKIRRLERERDEIAQSSTDIRRAAGEVSGVAPAVAPMGLPTSSYTPSGPMIRRREDAGFGVSGSALQPGAVEGIDPRMLDVLAQAVHYTNLKVDLISGKNGRSTGTTNHPDGNAFDLQLTTPEGKRLGNIRDEKAYRSYEEFGQIMNAIAKAKYPDMPFRWGGYFKGDGTRSGRGKKVNVDTMHWDNRGPPTQWGDFETGAAPGLRRVYPGITSVGMGDPLAFAARLEGFQMPGGNYRAPGQGAGALPPQPQLGAESTQRLDGITQEIESLRRQLYNSEQTANSYGKSPEEIARQNKAAFEEFLTGTYDNMIKNGERRIDRSRNFINSSDRQTQLSESLLRGDTPMQGATTEQAGMAFSPAQELQYLQRVNETLQAAVSATNVALTEAQSLLTGAEGTLANLQEEIQGYEPGSSLYEETATKIRATEQLIERYKAAVQEFGQADNEAVARLSRNLQSQQDFAPTLFGETKNVPLTNERGEPVLNQDGTQATTDVKVLGQLDQVTLDNLLGRLNDLDYAFSKLGKNINNFIVNVIDTFVTKLAESIMSGFDNTDKAALNQTRAELNAAIADASYQRAVNREDLNRANDYLNKNPNGVDSGTLRDRRGRISGAYQESVAARNEALRAAQENAKAQEGSGMGDALGGLAKEGMTTLLKTAMLAPFQGVLGAITGTRDGSSPDRAIYTKSADGKSATDVIAGAGKDGKDPGKTEGGILDSAMQEAEGFFSSISTGFSGMFDKISGWASTAWDVVSGIFSSSSSAGGSSMWGGLLSGALGLFGFAGGGHVRGPGTGTSDSIPAWLSNGEYVLTANEVNAIGLKNIEAWKEAMKSPAKFSKGGLVSTFDSAARSMANSSNTTGTGSTASGTVVNVIDQRSTSGSEPIETTKTQGPDGKEMISIMVKDAVKSAINSGSLDRTMAANYGSRRMGGRR